MRKWKSHKIVEGEEIESVYTQFDRPGGLDPNGRLLNLKGGEDFFVDEKTYNRIRDMADPRTLPTGYLVVYEDGYISWSPAEAFENGYTEVEI